MWWCTFDCPFLLSHKIVLFSHGIAVLDAIYDRAGGQGGKGQEGRTSGSGGVGAAGLPLTKREPLFVCGDDGSACVFRPPTPLRSSVVGGVLSIWESLGSSSTAGDGEARPVCLHAK